MSAARARIHAMFTLDETAETELNTRLDAHRAEELAKAATMLRTESGRQPERVLFNEGLFHGARLVDRMVNEAGREKDTREGESIPDFFQPGRTYTREHHGRLIRFAVTHVSSPPGSTWRVAFGFRLNDDGDWEPTDSDDLTGWTDTTNNTTTGDNT